jgi:alpha-tubulin suppressor-like RCC1 family protein
LNDAFGISAGAFFTCVAHAGGTVSCWGSNGNGELGTIDSLQHIAPSPVTVDTTGNLLAQVVQIAAGTGFKRTVFSGGIVAIFPHEHTCALLASGVIRCWGDNSQGEIGDGTTTNRARPTVVNSFAANVDPDAALRNSRVAEVTALIDCDAGDEAHIILALEQGSASGTAQTEARCQDRLVRVPMIVPAQGPTGFTAGAATAHVEAIVRSEGAILEDTHWTRQVTLSPAH